MAVPTAIAPVSMGISQKPESVLINDLMESAKANPADFALLAKEGPQVRKAALDAAQLMSTLPALKENAGYLGFYNKHYMDLSTVIKQGGEAGLRAFLSSRIAQGQLDVAANAIMAIAKAHDATIDRTMASLNNAGIPKEARASLAQRIVNVVFEAAPTPVLDAAMNSFYIKQEPYKFPVNRGTVPIRTKQVLRLNPNGTGTVVSALVLEGKKVGNFDALKDDIYKTVEGHYWAFYRKDETGNEIPKAVSLKGSYRFLENEFEPFQAQRLVSAIIEKTGVKIPADAHPITWLNDLMESNEFGNRLLQMGAEGKLSSDALAIINPEGVPVQERKLSPEEKRLILEATFPQEAPKMSEKDSIYRLYGNPQSPLVDYDESFRLTVNYKAMDVDVRQTQELNFKTGESKFVAATFTKPTPVNGFQFMPEDTLRFQATNPQPGHEKEGYWGIFRRDMPVAYYRDGIYHTIDYTTEKPQFVVNAPHEFNVDYEYGTTDTTQVRVFEPATGKDTEIVTARINKAVKIGDAQFEPANMFRFKATNPEPGHEKEGYWGVFDGEKPIAYYRNGVLHSINYATARPQIVVNTPHPFTVDYEQGAADNHPARGRAQVWPSKLLELTAQDRAAWPCFAVTLRRSLAV